MLASMKWLEELLDTRLDPETVRRTFLKLGIETEAQTSLAPPGIVTGRVRTVVPHPRQRDLLILGVNIGRNIPIVTADKNIKVSDGVLVGPSGITFNGTVVAPRDFDGVTSDGILISEEELGLAEKSYGAITLDGVAAGRKFPDCFDDLVFEIKTFPNRFDWLSMLGLARELALGSDRPFNPDKKIGPPVNRTGDYRITIRDFAGCPRYTARIFDGIRIKESPFWVKWRLRALGMNAINNVVDITNLNMLLYGQPLHPFDLDLLQGGIVIRRAKPGEEFVTLEGTVLKLAKKDVVIADQEGAIALAGIIGSRRAQISSQTTRVLLESAYFDPATIAATSRRLGLKTEASIRFERGADYAMVDETSKQTSALLIKYADGHEREFIGTGKKLGQRKITFSTRYLNRILSLDLRPNAIRRMLEKAHIRATGSDRITTRVPHYRGDLQIEEDIFEEVARLYGYMKIPEVISPKWVPIGTQPKRREYEDLLRNFFVGRGFNETCNMSLVAGKAQADLGYDRYVTIKNPLSERFDSLRMTLFVGLVDCIKYNRTKGNANLQLFEIGNILMPDSPFQEKHLAAVMGGAVQPSFWREEDIQIDYYDAKGIVEAIFNLFHIQNMHFRRRERKGLEQALAICHSNSTLGYLGVIDPRFLETEYFYFELNLDKFWPLVSESFYTPPAKYPANIRDLSFLFDRQIEAPDIIGLIKKVGGPILEKVTVFDYYQGQNIPAGKKSFGFRLFFKAPDRTLTDTEVESFIKRIVDEISRQFKAILRKKENK